MYANPYLYIFCNASNPQRFHEKFGEVDLEPVFALAQNPDKMPTMTSAHGVLPCFTTSNNRLWHDGLKRWMTAREKIAASGLPVSYFQVQAAKLCQGEAVDWQSDYSWHKRVGNGQQLQNVGLVLMSIFLNLKFKDSLPAGFLDIQPPSQPEGLVELEDKTYLLSIGGGGFKVPSKEIALKAHGALHVPLLSLCFFSNPKNLEGLSPGAEPNALSCARVSFLHSFKFVNFEEFGCVWEDRLKEWDTCESRSLRIFAHA